LNGGSSVADSVLEMPSGGSAGQMIRSAREARGVHIGALAASLKVPQRKLEALEADRFDELPDLAFTRALSQSVCRALKVDPQPVLALLPGHRDNHKLVQVANGMQAPFNDAAADLRWAALLRHPMLWATVALAAAAAALAFAPQRWMDAARQQLFGPAAPAASGPVASAGVASPVSSVPAVAEMPVTVPLASTVIPPAAASAIETVHSAPPLVATGASAAVGAVPAGLLTVRATAQSWVEVQDALGQTLVSRLLQAGETIGLDGALPLRVRLGNVAGTEVQFRGQAVDLSSVSRDNTARLQLK
jgi:cytoskeleton protein RodZ